MRYIVTISTCEKGVQWQQALQKLVAEMQAPGLELRVIRYIFAISTCEKGVQWQQALQKLFAEMQAQGLELCIMRYVVAISTCEKGFNGSRHCRRSLQRCRLQDWSYIQCVTLLP